ncbi:hypothetical protein R3P38DRAFT_2861464 [Favolaschia claudopus]|uniref:Uncharacterized protein n=1 Tax=Favolaschia claudopus TaxID=2862362 RepID=A0AAW0DLS4_9AGAR
MPRAKDAVTAIPDGFIQINDHPAELWSQVAFDRVEGLHDEERNRDPDAHDMYIYNDYFGYACCDLLKREMLAIGKLVASKKEKHTLATFHRIEALTLYMCHSGAADTFHTIDDGEFADVLYTAFGSLCLTYILNLESAAKPQKLSPTHPLDILNLENVIRTAAKAIMQFADMGFENEPNEVSDAMLRVLERNDMNGTPKEKLILGKSADSDDEDDDADKENEGGEGEDDDERVKSHRPKKKARRSGADDVDVRDAAKTWKASKAMKALREAEAPFEFYGRPWDITKWTKEEMDREKARFAGTLSDDNAVGFI